MANRLVNLPFGTILNFSSRFPETKHKIHLHQLGKFNHFQTWINM